MTNFADITATVRATGLSVVGAFNPRAGDAVPDGIGTLVLLGPAGPEMWQAFTAAPEASDTAPNPLDRWSQRVISRLAEALSARPFFPFGGPPWHPFQRWAARGEGAVASPVGMQATPGRGLWASYRGALGFEAAIVLPTQTAADPCQGCAAPCRTACPVGAFATGSYDVPACIAHLGGRDGAACRSGCLVRAACPAGASVELPETQRAFHMAAFLAAHG